MLVSLENFKVKQLDNQNVLREMAELQESTRAALMSLRLVLYDLRGQTGVDEGLTDQSADDCASGPVI